MSDQIGVQLNAKIKELATVAMLKCYIKYLVKSGTATTPEAVQQKLGQLCTAMLDRGDITQTGIDKLTGELAKSPLFLKTLHAQHHREKFINKVLIGAIMECSPADFGGENVALIGEAKSLLAQAMAIQSQLVTKYGDLLLGLASQVYHNYESLFDPGFAEKANELIGGDEPCQLTSV